MNKYLIPYCDIQADFPKIKVIIARTISECQEKLMNYFLEQYEELDECDTYREFVKLADSKDILIGDIKDIEEL